MSKENLLLIVWGLSGILSTVMVLVGSLWFMLLAMIWLVTSWKLLKEFFDDDDNYPDCLGI